MNSLADLFCYTSEALAREAARWQAATRLRLRWRSPVRLLRDKTQRDGLKGEARFCRRAADISFALLADRLYDTLADLLRRRGVQAPPRGPAPAAVLAEADLFWADCSYRDEQGGEQWMGGLLGVLELDQMQALPPAAWPLWVLGQYLGIGQRRAFGWGRYWLETVEGDSTLAHSDPVTSLLKRAVAWDNLTAAYAAIRANQDAATRPPTLAEAEAVRDWESVAVAVEDAMSVYVVCYDIEDDGIRVQLSRLLGEYGERVQRSVFEITLRSEPERMELQARLEEILGNERDVRFYCLCERCRTGSYSLAGEKVAVFPSAIIV